jgi:hypothetical protein
MIPNLYLGRLYIGGHQFPIAVLVPSLQADTRLEYNAPIQDQIFAAKAAIIAIWNSFFLQNCLKPKPTQKDIINRYIILKKFITFSIKVLYL